MIQGYEEKYVVFIDILGFKDIIQRTINEKDLYEKMYEILTRCYLETPNKFEFYEDKENRNQGRYIEVQSDNITTRVYTFSDSILITGNIEKHTLVDIFVIINRLVGHFLDLGIFCRGGFTKGLIRDDLQVSFGPAVIDAYNIENSKAIYPRIIIDNKVIDEIENVKNEQYNSIPISFVCPTVIYDNKDYFYDILNIAPNWIIQDGNCWRNPTWKEWMLKVRTHIINNLEAYKLNYKVLEKYIWFGKYYNMTLDKMNNEDIERVYF